MSLCIFAEESSAGDINIIHRENQDLFKQLEEVKELAAKNQKAFWIRSTVDGSRVASRERPVLPGRSPGSRRVTLPLDLRVPGGGSSPEDGARGRALPGQRRVDAVAGPASSS